jgi:hypothetical protein
MNEEIFKMVKTHGLSFVLMLGGLYFLNGKLTSAESRISVLEMKLYDCYEQKINTLSSSDNSEENQIPVSNISYAVLVDKKEYYICTKANSTL